jgi:hypothetical protein
MTTEVNIPDEAQIRAERAIAPYALSGPDTVGWVLAKGMGAALGITQETTHDAAH